jgi:protease PrsW
LRDQISDWSKLADSRLANRGARIAAIAILLAVVALGTLFLTSGSPDDPRFWPVLISGLLLASLASVPAVVLIRYLDRRDPEPWSIAALAYLWGATVATGFGLVLRSMAVEPLFRIFDESAALFTPTQFGLEITDRGVLFDWLETALAAPVIEESIKALALILLAILFPALISGVRDGVIYGALVGLGFAVMETALYIGSWYADAGISSYMGQLVPRFVFFGVNGHLIYTALFGAAFGLAKEYTRRGWVAKTLTVFGGLLLAISAHAMSNAFGPVSLIVLVSLFGIDPGYLNFGELWWLSALEVLLTYSWAYVILIYLTVRSGYSELEIIRIELGDERPPVVTHEERPLIEEEGLWRLRRLPWLSRRASVRVVRAQTRLAFRRRLMQRNGRPIDTDAALARLRGHIVATRDGAANRSADPN